VTEPSPTPTPTPTEQPDSLSLTLTANPPSPTAPGNPVTFAATISDTNASGTIRFKLTNQQTAISQNLGTYQVINGSASTVYMGAPGTYVVTATFSPLDSGSDTVTQTLPYTIANNSNGNFR